MTQATINIVPSNNAQFLTAEELNDPNNEIIFVQHSKDVDIEKIQAELNRMQEHKRGKEVAVTEIPGANCYPLAFDDGTLVLTKKVDHYYVALPKKSN
ncbi:hypothetical protein TVAG_080220 [Trichomonas vaginalis G3]|uniref:Uncharacterized protein n=1 Tax=Trichomonas vaginalis (strain ATCC PRA-98 / G3) TaxID=412133 RepID=A2FBH5_TRIV3|nr:hypothetical protein TVAGG3_1006440 [Trichomonas vaginalis G3]EAX97762.1 hypothetical protein TVAG_080220 [Trichomonas vaginalis G3]KAI5491163.1 hypothetical protein TVAGG3_1006440 [Trichomonas vaginalis G3]|eukprot:XP_001310692.1 hypothetical protein [Trichomonas vaginalis G3]